MKHTPSVQGAHTRRCTVCGEMQSFGQPGVPPREGSICQACGSRQRDRDQALALVAILSGGTELHLSSVVNGALARGQDLRVLEVAYRSPFVPVLSRLPGYVQAYRWPDGTARIVGGREVVHADLERLDFPDDSLDAVITSEVMQFVRDEARAHVEIRRVLRRGGAHVASVPFDWPFPAATRELFDLAGPEPVPVVPPRLFPAPDGGSTPLMRHYGADVVGRLNAMGYAASLRRSDFLSAVGRRNATLVAVKL